MRETTSNVPDIRPRPDPTVLTTAALTLAIDNLRDYVLAKIEGQAALFHQTNQANQEAIQKAEISTERRLGLLNEFRAQAADEAKKYSTIDSVEEKFKAVSARIHIAEAQISRMYGGIIVVGIIGVANLVKLWFTGLHS